MTDMIRDEVESCDLNKTESPEFVFRFVIIGDCGIGKSSIIHYFLHKKSKFRFILDKKQTNQTIGVDFSSKVIKLEEKEVRLQLWDTAGQEKFRSMAKNYYRGAIGIIIVYDVTK